MASTYFNSTNLTDLAWGFAANAVSVVFYGSNFVPIKRVETGDGMFFQWVVCAAIWMTAKIGDVVLHSPKVHPFAMLGGVIWSTGNIAVVPTVKAIGLGLCILISGSSSLLVGWASSKFGWFGITPQEVSRPLLNYVGAGLCLLSGLIFFFVKTDLETYPRLEATPLLIDRRMASQGYGATAPELWMDLHGPRTRRLIGCLLAVASGLMYGSAFTPIFYIKSHSSRNDSIFHGASLYDINYVYTQCSGIFLTSTLYFVLYCCVTSRPRVYPRAVLPAFLSGVMWTLATYCWFLANNYLSAVVTFPIISAGYGLVAALWGCLVFKEVKGLANCLVFVLASCVVLVGSVLTAISKL